MTCLQRTDVPPVSRTGPTGHGQLPPSTVFVSTRPHLFSYSPGPLLPTRAGTVSRVGQDRQKRFGLRDHWVRGEEGQE